VDMTFGAGGHTRELLKSSKDIKVFGLDRDPVAYELGQKLAEEYPDRFVPLLGRFSELPRLLQEQNIFSGLFYLITCINSLKIKKVMYGF